MKSRWYIIFIKTVYDPVMEFCNSVYDKNILAESFEL